MIALLNLSALGCSFVSFVFHDKAKRTQQGNLLVKNMKLNFDIFGISLKSNTLVRELTLGSMVPLAMFVFYDLSEKYLAKTTAMNYGRR